MDRAGFLCILILIFSFRVNFTIGQITTTTRYNNATTTTYRYTNTTTTRYQPTTTTRYQPTTNPTTTTRYQPTTTTTRYQPTTTTTTRYIANTTTTTRYQPTTTTTRPIVTTTTTTTSRPTTTPSSIQCNYILTSLIYSCELQISNPNGQEFTSIQGSHLSQKFDSDVIEVSGKFQNTKNIPSIICRKFTNLRSLEIIWSEVGLLSSESFRSCLNLEVLNLRGNVINEVPLAFSSNQRLAVNNFRQNRIENVAFDTFFGTRLSELDFGFNELRTVNSSWFLSVRQSLTKISLAGNRIMKVLRDGGYTRLQTLDMSMNPIRSIDVGDFGQMLALENLILNGCELLELNVQSFSSVVNLKSISINNNFIREFPVNLFVNQASLTDLSASGNRITTIDSRSFRNAMARLRSIYLQNNQLDSIDPEFFNNSGVLGALFLDGNLCNGGNYFIDAGNRETVRREIEICLRNFRYVRCQYSGSPDFLCRMSVRNLVGIDDFEAVEGQHPPGSNNANVRIVNIINGISTIFPSAICRQFTNLQEITASGNGIISLTTSSFQNCRNLRILQLISQEISVIPENVFANLANLQTLSLTMNKIQTISARSLTGLGSSMLNLYLNTNQISRIENGALNSLTNVTRIQFNSNRLTSINSAYFGAAMRNLVEFSANNNQINGTDPVWFNNSTLLDTLNLTGNICVNASFVNVRNSRNYVSSQLQNCFNRFRP